LSLWRGKKYKRCCLEQQSASYSLWAQQRDESDELPHERCLTHRIGKITMNRPQFPAHWLRSPLIFACSLTMIQIPVAVGSPTESAGQQTSYRDREITVQSRKVNDALVLSIANNGRQIDVKLPPEIFDVQQIDRYRDRLIVIGDIGASVSRVMIVRVDTGVASDSFEAFTPTVSPDGRFIAFVKFYPPHSATGTEDHHMLYDMIKSGRANRPAGVGLDDRFDVGLNVYPGHGNKEDDNIGVPERLAHNSPSLIFWSPDSAQLAFADQTESLKLVLVKVAGAAAPSVFTMPLDRTSVCAVPLSGNPCQAYLDQVKFADNELHAFFSGVGTLGSIHRELQVKYADLVASK